MTRTAQCGRGAGRGGVGDCDAASGAGGIVLLVTALVLVEVMVEVMVAFFPRLILCSRHRSRHFSYFVYSSVTLRKASLSLFYRCRTQLVHHPQL